ncbi:hypothetical protein [Dokdonella sp.]|uniref:hypothetical protein n=1 Tax=Dokdonella sp. TaxID=2291710 RepID=UPI001B25DA3B|nr:hypothetical protein [Dokdonella sp.]MBO9661973.1 hypothetical protein [Dokdonella sp.]
MSSSVRPIPFGSPGRELFAVAHVPAPQVPLRGGVLICPPFFHEQFLSYRLISLVAARLAAQGWLCLRFDYFGSGDSAGDDDAFSLAGATADTRTALALLRGLVADAPLLLLGVRAGVWPALAATDADGVARVCLWQPLSDGAAWLDQLGAMDAHERASRQRYPHLRAPRAAVADRLLGSHVGAALRAELAAQRTVAPRIAFDVVGDGTLADGATPPHRFDLPPALAGWETDLTIRNVFPGRELDGLVGTLVAAWSAGKGA